LDFWFEKTSGNPGPGIISGTFVRFGFSVQNLSQLLCHPSLIFVKHFFTVPILSPKFLVQRKLVDPNVRRPEYSSTCCWNRTNEPAAGR
jgi:hypothetical protein